MNDNGVADVIERLDYRCAVFSVVDADDVAILLKAYKELKAQLDAVPVQAIRHHRDGANFGYVYGQAYDRAAVDATNEAIDAWLETQVTP